MTLVTKGRKNVSNKTVTRRRPHESTGPGTTSVNKTSTDSNSQCGHGGTSLAKRYRDSPPGGARAPDEDHQRIQIDPVDASKPERCQQSMDLSLLGI